MKKLFLYLTFDNSNKDQKKLSSFKKFIRFKLLNFLLSPLVKRGFKIDKRMFDEKFLYLFFSNSKVKEWLSKYSFKLKPDNILLKVDIISQNNPMYYNTDKENELIIESDVTKSLNKILMETGMINFFKQSFSMDVKVNTEYRSEIDILNDIYDPKERENVINDMVLKRGFENKDELLNNIAYGKDDIKVIMFSVAMYYKHILEGKKINRNSNIMYCLLALIIIALTILIKY